MLPELTLAWHAALAESVSHDQACDFCLRDLAGRVIRCHEGASLYRAEQMAWREHKASEMLTGVA